MASVYTVATLPRSLLSANCLKTVYIKTFGCAASLADSEAIAGILSKAGYEISKSDDADVVVIVSCFVKGPTENAVLHYINQYKHKRLIIAGCMPDAMAGKLRRLAPEASLVGTGRTAEILDAMDKRAELLGKGHPKIDVPRFRRNKYCAVIPIASGCLGSCAYCCVKLVKGELQSYPEDLILKEARKAIAEGCKEIWLTSQDSGCYGKDTGTDIVKLLEKVLSMNGDFHVRLGMMNPNHVLECLDELVKLYKHPKLYKFIHIPVQSGSDSILKTMNRQYEVEDFKRIVSVFRNAVPFVVISTDLIVGFPGETEEDFEKSMKLIEETTPGVLNISRYWRRRNTPAAAIKGLPAREITRRSKLMTELYERVRLESKRVWIGRSTAVLVTRKGTKRNQYRGRTDSYMPVLVENSENLEGKRVKVSIKGARRDCLLAEIDS